MPPDSSNCRKPTISHGQRTLNDTCALICGGSQGIGLATARRFVELGGNVCIIARNADTLRSAGEALRVTAGSEAFVETICADTTDRATLEPAITDFIDRRGVPDYLINMVGFAYPQYVEQLSLDDFRRSMDTNYYGQLLPTLLLLPHFKAAGRGHIAHVSSMMGYFGIIGYAAYAPGKFAIAGLTEVLRHELRPHNIRLSILFPPDTDTPGFAIENETKPAECALMSEQVGTMSAEAVAREFVNGLLRGRYAIHPGQSRLVWRLHRFFPGLLRWVTDRQLRNARKRLGKTNQAR